jgi:hypothetical protein
VCGGGCFVFVACRLARLFLTPRACIPHEVGTSTVNTPSTTYVLLLSSPTHTHSHFALPLSLSPSLPLSLTHTHSYTLTHSLSLSLLHSHTLTAPAHTPAIGIHYIPTLQRYFSHLTLGLSLELSAPPPLLLTHVVTVTFFFAWYVQTQEGRGEEGPTAHANAG